LWGIHVHYGIWILQHLFLPKLHNYSISNNYLCLTTTYFMTFLLDSYFKLVIKTNIAELFFKIYHFHLSCSHFLSRSQEYLAQAFYQDLVFVYFLPLWTSQNAPHWHEQILLLYLLGMREKIANSDSTSIENNPCDLKKTQG